MNIPTANIFIAYDKETIEKLFFAGATYKNLVKEITDGGLEGLLFDNVSNPNFISFEHTHGMGSGFKMKLTFIDPRKEFEKRFIAVSPLEAFAGLSSPEVQKTKSRVTESKDEAKESQKNYKGGDVERLKRKLQKQQGARKLYVAYGTGNNLDLWSGPHVVTMVNASVDVKGSRQLTIELAAIPSSLDKNQRRGAYGERVDVNLFGLNHSFIGSTQEIKFTNDIAYDPTEYLDSPQNKSQINSFRNETQESLSKIGFAELGSKLRKYDFHTMVVDCIRSYVQKATNTKNVVVVLPDLNVACAQAINDKGKETGALKGGSAPTAGGGTGSYARAAVSTWEDPRQAEIGREETFVRETLQEFGINLVATPKDKVKLFIPAGFGHLGYLQSVNLHKNSKDAFSKTFKNTDYFGVIEKVDSVIPDHKETLKNIFDNISRMSHESYKPSSFCYGLMETNSEILKMWGSSSFGGSWAKHYPFAGYDDFYDDGPAVIVGDAALIHEYLYAGVDLNEKYESINKLKNSANRVSNNQAEVDGFTAEDLEIAAASEIPLHPMDRVLLANKKYNSDVREIFSRPAAVGAFGSISDIPDNFSYRDIQFTEKEKEYIRNERIPVFRYNTKNPNVIDVKFKYGAQYLAALDAGFEKTVNRLDSTTATGLLPETIVAFSKKTRNLAIRHARAKKFSQVAGSKKRREIQARIASKTHDKLIRAVEAQSPENAADTVAAIIELAENNNLRGKILVGQSSPGTPFTILTDVAEDLYTKTNRMDIQTLPMFHISELYNIMHNPCIVFAQDQEISQSRRPKSNAISQFYSGLYKIIAFKHTITSSNVSSSFSLAKTQRNVTPDDE